jgi:cobalt-zinc-cadmium efflux system outer membrane protein
MAETEVVLITRAKRSMGSIIALGLVALTSQTASAQTITFDQAIDLAKSTASGVKASENRINAARRASVAADQLPDPKLEVNFNDFRTNKAPPPMANGFVRQMVGIRQDIPNLKKRHARLARANADIVSAAADEAIAIRDVRLGAALAWIDLYYGEKRLVILKLLGANIADLKNTIGARLASGSAPASAAFDPEILAAELADRRSEREADVEKSRASLRRWTNVALPEVAGPLPTTMIDASAVVARIDTLPRLQAKNAAVGRAEAGVRLARANKNPDFSVNATLTRRQPDFGNFVSVGVSVDVPLFAKKRQDPIIDARLIEENAARLDRLDAEREERSALSSDLAEHRMLDEKLEHARKLIVPLARKRAIVAQSSYAASRLDLGSALNETIALANAEIDALDLEAKVARQTVKIMITYTGDIR